MMNPCETNAVFPYYLIRHYYVDLRHYLMRRRSETDKTGSCCNRYSDHDHGTQGMPPPRLMNDALLLVLYI
jgi:hypothetical protein